MRVRRIFRNTLVSLAGRGAGDVLGLLFLVIFARSYGSDVLGEFWYAMAIGAILGALIKRGTTTIILREASQQPKMMARYIGAAANLQLIIAIGLFVLLLVLSPIVADTVRAQSILIIIGLYQIGYVLSHVFRIYFNAAEEMQFNALLESGHKLMILVGGVVALILFDDPAIVLLIYPFAALTIYATGYTLVTRHFERPTLHFDWSINWKWTVVALPVFAHGIMAVIANRGVIILLGRAADAAAVGIFAAADRLVIAFGLPFIMLTGAVFPIMSKLALAPSELRRLTYTSLRISAVGAIPLSGLVILYRESIVTVVFGEPFFASADLLGVLAIGIVFTAINSMLSMLLVAMDHVWSLFRIFAVSLAVLFIGIFVTVGAYGPVGLAWSVVVSKAVASLGLLFYIGRNEMGFAGFRSIWGAAAGAISMVAAYYLMSSLEADIRNALTIGVGAIALILFRGIRFGDVQRVRQVMGK